MNWTLPNLPTLILLSALFVFAHWLFIHFKKKLTKPNDVRGECGDTTYRGRLMKARIMVRHPLIDLDDCSPNPSASSVSGILDNLIMNLEEAGELAIEETKVKHFEEAVVALNRLDAQFDEIETELREDLCEAFDRIGEAAGINCGKYGNGEGIATEWRDW